MSQAHTIWVVGSLNADLVQRVQRIPLPGETLPGDNLQTYPGGKGANQAFAAARLGAHVNMIGNVGHDQLGTMLIDSLTSVSVDITGVHRIDTSTGAASIFVIDDGDNAIVISPGANGCLSPGDIQERLANIQAGDILLCQLETPIDAILEALKMARAVGASTILDPAPATHCSPALLPHVDILTPNETEAITLSDHTEVDVHSTAMQDDLISQLRAQGCSSVILKLGEAGCYFKNDQESHRVLGHSVSVVDTTGAGDSFNGALAAALADGQALPNALEFANAAGSLTVTRSGAQPSIPHRTEVDAVLAQQPTHFR